MLILVQLPPQARSCFHGVFFIVWFYIYIYKIYFWFYIFFPQLDRKLLKGSDHIFLLTFISNVWHIIDIQDVFFEKMNKFMFLNKY